MKDVIVSSCCWRIYWLRIWLHIDWKMFNWLNHKFPLRPIKALLYNFPLSTIISDICSWSTTGWSLSLHFAVQIIWLQSPIWRLSVQFLIEYLSSSCWRFSQTTNLRIRIILNNGSIGVQIIRNIWILRSHIVVQSQKGVSTRRWNHCCHLSFTLTLQNFIKFIWYLAWILCIGFLY